ncbi:MAG TPA: hypothetical protein VMU70_01665, partial [Candidatus Tyrphobacter sp.]|nr:hypothetical protein [Candidatus Tyrphobacter sp.]
WGLHHAAERVLAGSAGPNAGGPRVLPTEKPGGAPPFTEQPSVGSNLENNIPSGGWPTGVDSHFFEAVDKIQSGDGIERVVTRHMELLAKVDPDTYDKISQSVAPGEHLDSGQIAHLLALRQHLENTGLAKPGGSIGVSAADGHITIHSETYAFPPDNAGSVVPLDHAPAAPDHGAVAPAPQAHDVAPNAAPTPPANNPFDYTHMKQPDLLRTLQAEEPALKNIPGGQGLDKRAQDMIGVLSHQASDPQIDSARKLMEDINNFFQSHGTHASTVSVTSEHIITSNIPGLETIDLDKANQSDLFRHLQTITEYLSKNPVGHGNVSQTLLDNARGIINVLSQPAGTRIDPAALDSARNLIVTLTGFLGKK